MRSRGRVGLVDLGEALLTPNVSLLMAEGGEGGEVESKMGWCCLCALAVAGARLSVVPPA